MGRFFERSDGRSIEGAMQGPVEGAKQGPSEGPVEGAEQERFIYSLYSLQTAIMHRVHLVFLWTCLIVRRALLGLYNL